ncbi:breast carcinoma-amplified sequence 1 isoform 2-T2 [Discoglossus pictus]
MGNELSTHEVAEDQNANVPGSDSESETEFQNEEITVASSPGVCSMPPTDRVDSKQTVQKENVTTTSQKTIVISPFSNGIEAKPPVPTAQSKYRVTISRPVPGRTTFQANGPNILSAEPVRISGNPPVIQVQKDTPVVLETVVTQQSSNGDLNKAPPTITPAEVQIESTPSKPKEINIFQRIFKPERKVQVEVPTQNQQEENQEPAIVVEQMPSVQSSIPQVQNVDDCKPGAVQVQISSEVASQPAQEYKETNSQAIQTTPTEEVHPVMSFFKTLVSPNKSVVKSEEEPKNEVDDKKNGGLRKSSSKKEKTKKVSKQMGENEAKGSKTSESPKSGTLSRLFRTKSKKDEQQNVKQVVEEQAVVAVSVKSEQSAPVQILTQDTKTSELNVQPQISEQKEDAKAAKESTPRVRPFWRKSLKEEPQVIILTNNASAEPDPQPTDSKTAASGNKASENKKPEEGKNVNAKPKLMMFFKQLSVIGDGGFNANSRDVNEKSTNQPTLDITDGAEASKTEKSVTTAVVEAPAPPQKNKENLKEKKGSPEKIIKQESREIAEPVILVQQQQVPDQALVQNGSDSAKEVQLKRTEKRQSLGNFFKAIGPRRMCDAEVQTDPVTIYPVEKMK